MKADRQGAQALTALRKLTARKDTKVRPALFVPTAAAAAEFKGFVFLQPRVKKLSAGDHEAFEFKHSMKRLFAQSERARVGGLQLVPGIKKPSH
jgi:hypothetical protein